MRWLIQGFGQTLTPQFQQFHAALDQPDQMQRSLQRVINLRAMLSEYGKSQRVRNLSDWSRLPIVTYDELLPWMRRDAGQLDFPASALTPEPILFYEPTSGSRGPVKWIPYTKSLKQSFHRMFCIWLYDLIFNEPKLSTGKTYFCISPKFNSEQSSERALSNDSDYLNDILKWILRPFLVMPKIDAISDIETFQYELCLALLKEANLEVISIWSPSFLSVHLDYIQTHRDRFRSALTRSLSRSRLACLNEPVIPWTELWPQLKLISCWDSANSADLANGLRSRFPGVMVQGKGLLATEAPMTIPLSEANGFVPLLNEVFFEFETATGEIRLLHELSVGETYQMIISQKGGLYRYRIGDRVKVTHFYRNTPCLDFVGRDGSVSDLVGEKLNESFIKDVIATVEIDCTFQSLVPTLSPTPHYLLLLDQCAQPIHTVAQTIDTRLCDAYHYQQARALGQLAPIEVLVSPQIPELLMRDRLHSERTWGGMKHALLATQTLSPELINQIRSVAHSSVSG